MTVLANIITNCIQYSLNRRRKCVEHLRKQKNQQWRFNFGNFFLKKIAYNPRMQVLINAYNPRMQVLINASVGCTQKMNTNISPAHC